jgi:hypothetical protein
LIGEGTQACRVCCSIWNVGLSAVLTRSEQYRVKARECAEYAEHARDPETKRAYEDMARQWLDLAKWAEKEGGGS